VLKRWGKRHDIQVQRLDEGQQWVVFAALQVVVVLGKLAPLRRLLAWVLAHSGMDLGSMVIGAITGVSDRAVRTTKALEPEEILHSVRTPSRGRGKAKLGPEHAGLVAKYLVEHPNAKVKEILAFIKKEFGVTMDRLTLRRYIHRYGLGCLRGETHTDAPLF
jgi:transposase